MSARLHPDERRSQLIDVAVALLEDARGSDLVIDDVARRAGVSRALVYRYFAGIEDLLGHARQRFLADLCTELAGIDGDADPLDRMRATVAACVRFAAAQPATFCNVLEVSTGAASQVDPMLQAIKQLIPSVRSPDDATLAAAAVTALLQGGIVCWVRSGRTDIEAATELLFALVATSIESGARTDSTAEAGRIRWRTQGIPAVAAP